MARFECECVLRLSSESERVRVRVSVRVRVRVRVSEELRYGTKQPTSLGGTGATLQRVVRARLSPKHNLRPLSAWQVAASCSRC